MFKYDFYIKQGESFIQDIYFKNKTTKEIIPFESTAVAKAQIKRFVGNHEVIADIDCALSPEKGKISLYLSEDITANIPADIYYYDLAITEYGAITYYLEGKFIIKKKVTEV